MKHTNSLENILFELKKLSPIVEDEYYIMEENIDNSSTMEDYKRLEIYHEAFKACKEAILYCNKALDNIRFLEEYNILQ